MPLSVNEGPVDRGLRIILAVLFAALALTDVATGTLAVVFYILAALLVVTGILGFCPLYLLFGVDTRAPGARVS